MVPHRIYCTTITRLYTATLNARTTFYVRRIFHWQGRLHRSSIAAVLQSTARHVFTDRPYLRLSLSSFQPVTTEEVRRLLSAMPPKSSPLDVLPCSLLKTCADVFSPIVAKLANLSIQTGKFPARFKQAQVTPLLKKPGLITWKLQTDFQPVNKVLEWLVDTPSSSSAQLGQL